MSFPQTAFFSMLLLLLYFIAVGLFWSRQREELRQVKENWRTMKSIRRVFLSGLCVLLIGIFLCAFV